MENHLIHSKTFRYETSGSVNPKKVIYVLHGYGQLAKYFIRKFSELEVDWMIVAPEGMHRFYLNGSSGRVGASWMTKEAREIDIYDNLSWLDELKKKIDTEHGKLESHVLGFSQGGATAARWINNSSHSFKSLCLWACVFPPDLQPEQLSDAEIEKYFVIGSQDEYYNDEQQNEQISIYNRMNFKAIQYMGNHDIDTSTLLSIYQKGNNE